MDDLHLKSFIERYNKDKEELNRKFEELNKKLDNIDNKFEVVDETIQKIGRRISDAEDIQKLLFGNTVEFGSRLDNVKLYLSCIETKLNECKCLEMQGQKVINGDLYLLKIKLHKIRPIIRWENDKILDNKFKEIEDKIFQLEDCLDRDERISCKLKI